MEKVTKGCTVELDDGYYFDVEVHTYNTGFYITTRERKSIGAKTEIDTTTRSTPTRVISYIGSELRKRGISELLVDWKPNVKVIKDKVTGHNKTNI